MFVCFLRELKSRGLLDLLGLVGFRRFVEPCLHTSETPGSPPTPRPRTPLPHLTVDIGGAKESLYPAARDDDNPC